jgi:hypothetical protein
MNARRWLDALEQKTFFPFVTGHTTEQSGTDFFSPLTPFLVLPVEADLQRQRPSRRAVKQGRLRQPHPVRLI